MAHFAELDNNNVVLRVVVISNDDVDANGGDLSTGAEDFVEALIPASSGGVAWKQTSYNNNLRKNFAGIGYTYDESRDAFLLPQPYPSWTLNETTCQWEPPTSYPDDNTKPYFWDESNLTWTPTS